MNEPEVFVLADRTLLSVVEQIQGDQWVLVWPVDKAAAPLKGPAGS